MSSDGPVEALYRQLRESGKGTPLSGERIQPACALLSCRVGDAAELLLACPEPRGIWPNHWRFPIELESDCAPPELGPRYELGPLSLSAVGARQTPGGYGFRYHVSYYAGAEQVAGNQRVRWCSVKNILEEFAAGRWLVPPVELELARALAGGVPMTQAIARLFPGPLRVPHALCRTIEVCPLETLTLPPATHTNCYLVGARDFVVIDPGPVDGGEQRYLEQVIERRKSAGGRLRAILLTHHHGDHVGGAAALSQRTGAPLHAHPETARRLGAPMIPLEDGMSLEFDDCRLTCLFTPGHAAGHLCFLDRDSRFLIAGDMVAGLGTILIDPDDGDMAAYLASLERMKQAKPARLLPAHGLILADPTVSLDGYIHHRLWRERRVLDELRARGPVALRTLTEHVYKDVPAGIWPLAERSLLAHLRKLAAEGQAENQNGSWISVA